eukprot:scaffold5873_cov172-Amphora_coffeaeformis.AAC.11
MPYYHHPKVGRTSCRSLATTSSTNSSSSSSGKTNITVTAGGVVALVAGAAVSARFLYGQLVGDHPLLPSSSNPRRDESRATVLIQTIPTPPNAIQQDKLASDSKGGTLQQVDAAAFTDFVTKQRAMLQRESKRVQQEASRVFHEELAKVFPDADDRVSSFCDWYLAYPTTYKFLGIALSSAAAHAVTIKKEQTLAARVAQDLQEHICRKYEALVLRPGKSDPQIHRAMVAAIQTAHEGYQEALGNLESSLAEFVAAQARPYYGKPPSAQDVVVSMDWTAQLQKVQHIPSAYEKTPSASVALVAVGAAAGKVVGSGAGLAATKALSAKLAAPFATKAAGTALAGKAAAGATGGAILGGPLGGAVGAAAGAALGIGLDMTVNAGVALLQRGALEQDVREALEATVLEWEELLQPEIVRVSSIWFDHAAAALTVDHKASKNDQPTKTVSPSQISVVAIEKENKTKHGENESLDFSRPDQ